jgi:hypothetical protein
MARTIKTARMQCGGPPVASKVAKRAKPAKPAKRAKVAKPAKPAKQLAEGNLKEKARLLNHAFSRCALAITGVSHYRMVVAFTTYEALVEPADGAEQLDERLVAAAAQMLALDEQLAATLAAAGLSAKARLQAWDAYKAASEQLEATIKAL